MTPQLKKTFSAAGVILGVFALRMLATYVVKLPVSVQADALVAITGFVHLVNAWGTADQVNTQVTAKVAEVVERDQP